MYHGLRWGHRRRSRWGPRGEQAQLERAELEMSEGRWPKVAERGPRSWVRGAEARPERPRGHTSSQVPAEATGAEAPAQGPWVRRGGRPGGRSCSFSGSHSRSLRGQGRKNKLKAIHTRSSNPSFSRRFPDLSEPRLPIHEIALLGTTVRYY